MRQEYLRVALAGAVMSVTACTSVTAQEAAATSRQSPQAALDELIATERALSEAAAKLSPAEGIASLLADDGILYTRPAPVTGRAAAVAALQANPANAGTFAKWRSIRGGISADGLHGYTLGYLDIEGGNSPTAKRRYLAYWTRGARGWRVAAMKQIGHGPQDEIAEQQPPTLPSHLIPPQPADLSGHEASLIAAEKAFSDRAQVVGIKQAFQDFGRPDAIHVFGIKGFSIGLPAIKANHEVQEKAAGAGPTPINWSADTALVASSGDLGITFGKIRRNDPAASLPPGALPGGNPFFTIWYRDSTDQAWKYIAE